ncbi:MAG TPA: hypothetical protein VFM54_14110 [Micromonosporaceae bacterium]|nr:hypothetical protein [Micromonosporaceae bacterium]
MNGILKGVRPLDYVLADVMTAIGAYLMYENVVAAYGNGPPYLQPTTVGVMLPAFVLVALPILWRRRNILAVIGVTAVAAAVHVVLFGWNTRWGVELPLTLALAYAVGRFAGTRTDHLIGLTGIVLAQLLVIARDASIDTVLSVLPTALPGAALFYGIGLFVQTRSKKQSAAAAPVIERPVA